MAKKKKKNKNFVSKEQKVNLIQKEDKEESIEELLSEEEVSVEEELPVFEESLDDESNEAEEEPKERERQKVEEEVADDKKEAVETGEPRERERQKVEEIAETKEEPKERERQREKSLADNKKDEPEEKSAEKVEVDKKDDNVKVADNKKEEPKEKEKSEDRVELDKQDDNEKETNTKQNEPRERVLEIKNLKTFFYTDEGVVKSVNDVSYYVNKGETLGVVGESGCGKSVTAMSILRLIPQPPGKIVGGEILFKGRDLTKISDEEMRHIRGNRIAMIFQEPMTSLNPVYTVGDQIIEAICLHMDKTYNEARAMALSMLEKVGSPAPANRIDEYPHQMSGGMKQRVMIAMALVCNPELLIADEPTTALDVTIQAQILELLVKLQKDFGTSIIMITHDLGVIAEIAHRVVVMYASKIVETAEVKELFANPKHPYTIGLFNSIPKLDTSDRLIPIKGMVPNPLDFPVGCKFNNRCEFATEKCRKSEPTLKEISPGHWSACWLNEK